MIAQMESDYQASRLLWLRAGWLKNRGRRNTRETGLAKWFATVASERAAGDAVQVHGANGYSDEYPVGRFYRNCKGAVIYEGTREIHKVMQADYVLGFREDRPTRCELPAGRGERNGTGNRKMEPPFPLPFPRHFHLPCMRTSRSNSSASSNRPRSPARTRWARATGTSRIGRPSRRCAATLDTVPIDGTIVIGEGERDEAPMLYIGEKVGSRAAARPYLPKVDIAVDPLEGTNLCATGAPNAIAVLAASEGGGLLHAPDLYMEKLVVGPSGEGRGEPRRAGGRQPARRSPRRSSAASRTWSSSCSIGRATRS